jgi:hypothetical protein
MNYTSNIENDQMCNYINPNIHNSHQMLLACINKPDNNYDCPITRGSVNIEGFSSDMSSSGVYYIPEGSCPDGFQKKEDKCIQIYRGRERNGNWQRSHHHGEITHNQTNQNNINICGDGFIFKGIDSNGYIDCESSDKTIQQNDVEENDDDDNFLFSGIL